MLFVSMKMSSGVAAAAAGCDSGHSIVLTPRADQRTAPPAFVMLTGGDLRGTVG